MTILLRWNWLKQKNVYLNPPVSKKFIFKFVATVVCKWKLFIWMVVEKYLERPSCSFLSSNLNINDEYTDLIEIYRNNPALRFKGAVSREELQLFVRRYNLDSHPELEEYFGIANGGIAGPGVLLSINTEDDFLSIDPCKDIDHFILCSSKIPIATDCGLPNNSTIGFGIAEN